MSQSPSIANLASALSKAQAKLPKVKFDAKNPFLNNSYATLGAVIETAKPILAEFGLAVVQFPVSQEGRIGVRTALLHESGEFMEDVVTLVPESAKGLSINQSAGVTISYLRRYAYVAVLSMYADEDTDGDVQNADSQDNAKANEQVKSVFNNRTWSMEQMEAVVQMFPGGGEADIDYDNDVKPILDFSVLPENAPVKTVQSWFKHYLSSNGTTPMLKAADANEAYNKAKKNGGKS